MNENLKKIIRQLHPEPTAFEIIKDVEKIEADEILELEKLREENPRLRKALEEAQSFIQIIGTEDPDDVETMAMIEGVSGRIAAALEPNRLLARPATGGREEP